MERQFLFASLFATYLALKDKVPSPEHAFAKDLFELPFTFVNDHAFINKFVNKCLCNVSYEEFSFKKMMLWLLLQFYWEHGFLGLEIYEFNHYVHEFHHTFTSSAFGSAFLYASWFSRAHVAFGLLWIITLMLRNAKSGLNLYNAPKFYVASLILAFIDVVWVFIFTVVYLMGMVG